MLVLTRNVGESLIISDSVTVTILKNKDGQIRIGIDAPRNISVMREELLEMAGDYFGMNGK